MDRGRALTADLLLGVQLQYSGNGRIEWHAGPRRDHGADYQEPGGRAFG
jgi:hypothetical protein